MVYFLLLALCLLIIVIIFSFPQFSPIPYFPSNKKDLPLILDALQLKNNQTVIDLGAGDGVVIFKSASKAHEMSLNTRFIATDINPVLLLIMHIRRLLHPNRKNITIMHSDMFICTYSDFITLQLYNVITFYIYISPWFIEKTVQNIQRQIPRFNLVSYFYQVKYLPKHKEVKTEGIHAVYQYNYK